MSDQKYTNFGFRKILYSEKQSLVDSVFSGVADKYDLMNDLMSLGIHRVWKREFLKKIPDFSGKLLDVAAGSGDISLGYYKSARDRGIFPQIVASDVNPDMLKHAKSKSIDKSIVTGIDFTAADATALPFEDESFDYVTIAFGIRNVPEIKRALGEFKRVLKKGGKFLCLEFSPLEKGIVSNLYELYSFNIIPKIGKFITNNEEAYQYLVESIKKFPKKDQFRRMIEDSGFESASYKSMTSGVVCIHWGYKL
jgi:demethylmenaquinone methyltransferase / 2-methoxy-6-polyprenyl-1,4-benzoquinol methylase